MTSQLYKNYLNFQTFNEGSFIFDLNQREISLSKELVHILKCEEKKSYKIDEFFDKYVLLENYEGFMLKIKKKFEQYDENIFFDNLKIKDLKGNQYNFTIKGKVYGEPDNRKIVCEVFEKENYIGDRNVLMTVLNAMPDSIIILKNNEIFFANMPAIKLFGYKYSNEIIGEKIDTYIKNPKLDMMIKRYLDSDDVENRFDEELFNAVGKKIDVEISVASMEDDYVILTLRDIGKRKNLEREKLESADKIIKMKSNLKVTQEKLVSQEKMAGIGQLATGIVHEIFNPLGFVMSNFSTLKTYFNDIRRMIDEINRDVDITKEKILQIEDKCDIDFIMDDINDLFADVEEGIFRINGIILNLKKFSRQEADEFIEYDINEGIQSTLVVAKNEYKYVADVLTKLNDLPYTRANASKINQVLLNLIINASHAIKDKNDDERGLISISTFAEDNYIVCQIIDTGIGIDEDVYNKIFEPFYTTKPVGIGTGLGLSISYDIITKQHKGSIFVESEKGKGSKFTIKIPIVDIMNE